ncbi:MAG TPA: YtxH domain-containing protein [Bryobacteraceae bacterium]|jgi:gas vesicle protein
MAQQHTDSALWFFAGAALGATIALLYAPESGHHTRKRIRKVAGTSADKVAESGRQMADLGKELYEKGRKMVDEANSMFERGRKMIDESEIASGLGEG